MIYQFSVHIKKDNIQILILITFSLTMNHEAKVTKNNLQIYFEISEQLCILIWMAIRSQLLRESLNEPSN